MGMPIARGLVRPALLMTGLLAGLIAVSVGIGYQQRSSEWKQGLYLDECTLPCWIGIEPGITALKMVPGIVYRRFPDAVLQVERNKSISGYYFFLPYIPNRQIQHINVRARNVQGVYFVSSIEVIYERERGPSLREYILLLDEPIAVQEHGSSMREMIYFNGHLSLKIYTFRCEPIRLSSTIASLYLSEVPNYGYYPSILWRGLGYPYATC
jgi:hypothetical protein